MRILKTLYTMIDAWTAFEQKNYQLAGHIWLSLMAASEDAETHCRIQLGYALVLIAQRQFREATALLNELYEITGDSICLHQLGYTARESGNLDLARTHFMAEQACLPYNNYLALAVNAYELGMIALEQNKLSVAFHYARRSVEYAQQAKDPIAEGYAYHLLGEVRQSLKDPEKAQDCYEACQQALARLPQPLALQNLDLRVTDLLLHPIAAA